ncbi:hypothetical protein [Bradyrhizobium sp.]|jgi:hypothetical protein|uniref:hypothetical protein n=1 Tax=Bradyrhizobium sp. TaxID=376 RepID=UPI003C24E7DC
MTAIIYHFDRSAKTGASDETERLLAALGRYTTAELLELLYIGEEPGFFELMRGIFGLSDETRLVLQDFLKSAPSQTIAAEIDQQASGVLTLRVCEQEDPIEANGD